MSTTRRQFVKLAAGAIAAADARTAAAEPVHLLSAANGINLTFKSKYYSIELSQNQTTFASFATDSLGKSELDSNVMLPSPADRMRYHVARVGNTVEYRINPTDQKPAWSFTFTDTAIAIRSVTTDGNRP